MTTRTGEQTGAESGGEAAAQPGAETGTQTGARTGTVTGERTAIERAITGTAGRVVIAVLGIAAAGALGLTLQGASRETIFGTIATFLLVALVVSVLASLAWRAAVELARAAGVALSATVPWLPALSSVGTLVAFYALSGEAFLGRRPAIDPAWAIPIGVGVALLCWLAIAALSAGNLTAKGSNERAYGEVKARTRTLAARFSNVTDDGSTAYAEIKEHLNWLGGQLEDPTADSAWASGVAYLDAWVAVHRAEEALLEFAKASDLAGEILHDQLRVRSSRLGAESTLLSQRLDEAAKALGLGENGRARAAVDPSALAEARAVAREVRHAINDFRDARWDGLVRARIRLTKSTQMTSWTAYLLLGIAIVLDAPPGAIGAAVVFYLVGAVIGLFARLRSDARLDEAVEDYGLAVARLRQTVVASGLAALAGVVLFGISAGAGLTAEPKAVSMVTIFNVSTPGGLLIAAIFGLAPNLLLDRLRTKSDEYRRELGDTAPVNGSEGGTGTAGALSADSASLAGG